MKCVTLAMIGVLVLLAGPISLGAQPMYRCVDASGNVSFGSGASPGAVNCSQYTVRPARRPEPPSSATPTMTFEELAKTCDDYARAQAAPVSQSGPPASSLDATCEENMRERYRRDSGQPTAEEPR
jgi:hypothetical protein